jgi:hypothetical protein
MINPSLIIIKLKKQNEEEEREMLVIPPLSHSHPTNPKCKSLKINLLNKKFKSLRVGGMGVETLALPKEKKRSKVKDIADKHSNSKLLHLTDTYSLKINTCKAVQQNQAKA